MMNVKKLVQEGKTEEAALVVYKAIFHAVNRVCPGLNLTPEDFVQIIDPLKKLLLGTPEEEEDPLKKYETTEEPGDDIILTKAKAWFTVTFVCDDPQVKLPQSVKKAYAVGDEISYYAPEVTGYIPDIEVVEGNMTEQGLSVTITYVKEPEPPAGDEEPAEVKYITAEIIDDDASTGADKMGTVEDDGQGHVVVTINNAQYKFEKKGGVHGGPDGWWGSAKIKGISEAKIEGAKKPAARIKKYNGTHKKINDILEKSEEDFGGFLSPEYLSAPNGPTECVEYFLEFDFDGDGIFEQNVTVRFDPKGIYLLNTEGDKVIYPAGAEVPSKGDV